MRSYFQGLPLILKLLQKFIEKITKLFQFINKILWTNDILKEEVSQWMEMSQNCSSWHSMGGWSWTYLLLIEHQSTLILVLKVKPRIKLYQMKILYKYPQTAICQQSSPAEYISGSTPRCGRLYFILYSRIYCHQPP